MIRAVASLARHRLAGRAGATLLLVAAVAAATGLAGTIRTLGLAATDAAVAASLADLDPADRTLRISGYAPSNAGPAELDRVALDATAQTTAFTDETARRPHPPPRPRPRRAVRPPARRRGRVGQLDHPPARVEHRPAATPRPARRFSCRRPRRRPTSRRSCTSAISRSGSSGEPRSPPRSRSATSTSAARSLRRWILTAQAVDPPPALLLVDGVAALARPRRGHGRPDLPVDGAAPHLGDPSVDRRPRSSRPSRPPAEGWSSTARTSSSSAPSETIRSELVQGRRQRRAAAHGRVPRGRDPRGVCRLRGPPRTSRPARRAGSPLLGRVRAAPPGPARRARGARPRRARHASRAGSGRRLAGGALAAGAGADPGGVVAHALADGGSLALAGLVLSASVVAILAGLFGVTRREMIAGLVPGGIAVAALVGWRLVAGGGLDAGALGGATDAPVLAATPGAGRDPRRRRRRDGGPRHPSPARRIPAPAIAARSPGPPVARPGSRSSRPRRSRSSRSASAGSSSRSPTRRRSGVGSRTTPPTPWAWISRSPRRRRV